MKNKDDDLDALSGLDDLNIPNKLIYFVVAVSIISIIGLITISFL